MKRIWLMGVGLALILGALSAAIAIPAAQAAEFGICKAASGGEYSDGACKEGAVPAEGGSFEWEPAPSEYTGTLGHIVGETPPGPPLTCSGGSSELKMTGTNTGTVVTTDTGCESEGHKCTSLNASNEGEIKTFEIEAVLIEHGEKGLGGGEPAGGEAWMQFSNQAGAEAPWLYNFGCPGFGYFEVGGWFSGRTVPTNMMLTNYEQEYKPGVAEQHLRTTGCPTSDFDECFLVEAPSTATFDAAFGAAKMTELRLEPPSAPRVNTRPATEVTTSTARLNATVIPDGSPNECLFDWGTTEAYGNGAGCSPSPGSGPFRVAVSAVFGGLVPDTTYHYRITSANGSGTSDGIDQTFTTLASEESASSSEPSVPAVAEDGPLSAEASGGTGTVTVGIYGSEIGGPPILGGAAPYIDVYHGAESTFTKVQFSDCELDGADELWWYDQSSGWEPVSGAVYTEGSPSCITATVTETSSPSLAQLTGTRFGAVGLGSQEYGKCEPDKKASYADAGCTTLKEKNGAPVKKGKYEWYWTPNVCFAKKKGFYSDSTCQTRDENKKGKPKGTFEKGSDALSGSTGPLKLEAVGSPALECEGGTIAGELAAEKKSIETITFSGCVREGVKCSSRGQLQEGTIKTNPLEDFTYKEGESPTVYRSFSGGLGLPSMTFNCDGIEYSLAGKTVGVASGDVNVMSPKGETAFTPTSGEQALTLQSAMGAEQARMTLTETTSGEAMEIDTSSAPHSPAG